MYKTKVFSRFIYLQFFSAVFVSNAYALPSGSAQDSNEARAATATNPPESKSADLNGDGRLDFVTTDSDANGVSIYLGLEDGGFSAPVNYLTGIKPLTVKIRDFNNDNQLDLAAINFKKRTVSVLRNVGDGSFAVQKAYRLRSSSMPTKVGQLNTDKLAPSSSTSAAKALAVPGIAALEQSVQKKINAYRATRGLPALPLNATISNVARTHSQNMASGKVPFGHQGFQTRIQTLSKTFVFRAAGENVAYNRGFSDPAATAVNGWLKSAGHLTNIIGNYNLTGIGVATNSKGEYYFTQFFWRR
jgi:uncharacterized protein YkwD